MNWALLLLQVARRGLESHAGSVAIIAGLMFPVVIGGIGLGAETGYWYLSHRKLQHVADVSAHAAALRKRAGDTEADFTEAARFIALQSGYKGPPNTIEVVSPPKTGVHAGKKDAVEVVATVPLPRYFTSFFTRTPLTIRARAVANFEGRPACILALSPSASGAIQAFGTSSLDMAACDLVSNSTAADSFAVGGQANVIAGCVYSSGGVSTKPGSVTTTECPQPVTNSPPVADPYADVQQPAVTGPCAIGVATNATLTPTASHPSGMPAMRFCTGVVFRGNIHLNPGLYIVEALFDVNNSTLTGTGVTIFFAKGINLTISSSTVLNLSAPTSGTYSGMLLFGDRTDGAAAHTINGASTATYQGAIYFPSAALEFAGRSATEKGCTQLIARTIRFAGTSAVKGECEAAGTRDMAAAGMVRVVE